MRPLRAVGRTTLQVVRHSLRAQRQRRLAQAVGHQPQHLLGGAGDDRQHRDRDRERGGEAGEAELDDPDRVDEQAGDDRGDAAHGVDEDRAPAAAAARRSRSGRSRTGSPAAPRSGTARPTCSSVPTMACAAPPAVADDERADELLGLREQVQGQAPEALDHARSRGSAPAARPSPGRRGHDHRHQRGRRPSPARRARARRSQYDGQERSEDQTRKPTRAGAGAARSREHEPDQAKADRAQPASTPRVGGAERPGPDAPRRCRAAGGRRDREPTRRCDDGHQISTPCAGARPAHDQRRAGVDDQRHDEQHQAGRHQRRQRAVRPRRPRRTGWRCWRRSCCRRSAGCAARSRTRRSG